MIQKPSPPLNYDVHASIGKAKFHHAQFPSPLEEIEASVHCMNGQIPLIKLKARFGPGTVAVTLKDLDTKRLLCPGEKHPQDLFREMDVKLDNINVTEDLYKPLPAEYGNCIWNEYHPTGPASISYSLRHEGRSWKKRLWVQPEGARAEYIEFRYPVDHVTGTIVHESSNDAADRLHLELVGQASNRPVHIIGDMIGERPDHEVNLTIWGENLPLDKKVETALASHWHAGGRGRLSGNRPFVPRVG